MGDWREMAGDQNLRLTTKLLEQQGEISRLSDENRDLRAAVARAEQATDNLGHALNVVQLRGIRQGQREEAIRKLHADFEGRCTACVEYCDCLERGRTRLEDCTHGNVEWPCATIKALAADVPAGAPARSGALACGPGQISEDPAAQEAGAE